MKTSQPFTDLQIAKSAKGFYEGNRDRGKNVFNLAHQDVEQFVQFKTADYDRWLGGMRKLRRNIKDQIGSTRLEDMHKLV